eukprot:scaffold117344_cov35-Prasinocladus_malaysianus.AAC.1
MACRRRPRGRPPETGRSRQARRSMNMPTRSLPPWKYNRQVGDKTVRRPISEVKCNSSRLTKILEMV